MIINCAGLANVDSCEAQPELSFQLNVVLAEEIAKVSNYIKFLLFIFQQITYLKEQKVLSQKEILLIQKILMRSTNQKLKNWF